MVNILLVHSTHKIYHGDNLVDDPCTFPMNVTRANTSQEFIKPYIFQNPIFRPDSSLHKHYQLASMPACSCEGV